MSEVKLLNHIAIGSILNQPILIVEVFTTTKDFDSDYPKDIHIHMKWVYIPLLQKHQLDYYNKTEKRVVKTEIYSGINQDQALKFWNSKLIELKIVQKDGK